MIRTSGCPYGKEDQFGLCIMNVEGAIMDINTII